MFQKYIYYDMQNTTLQHTYYITHTHTHTTLCTHTHIPYYAHITGIPNHLDAQDFDTQQS